MHKHKDAEQCQERQHVKTKRRFGESGAQAFWVSWPWELINKVRVVRLANSHLSLAKLLCFARDKWVENRETGKFTAQCDKKN